MMKHRWADDTCTILKCQYCLHQSSMEFHEVWKKISPCSFQFTYYQGGLQFFLRWRKHQTKQTLQPAPQSPTDCLIWSSRQMNIYQPIAKYIVTLPNKKRHSRFREFVHQIYSLSLLCKPMRMFHWPGNVGTISIFVVSSSAIQHCFHEACSAYSSSLSSPSPSFHSVVCRT